MKKSNNDICQANGWDGTCPKKGKYQALKTAKNVEKGINWVCGRHIHYAYDKHTIHDKILRVA